MSNWGLCSPCLYNKAHCQQRHHMQRGCIEDTHSVLRCSLTIPMFAILPAPHHEQDASRLRDLLSSSTTVDARSDTSTSRTLATWSSGMLSQ